MKHAAGWLSRKGIVSPDPNPTTLTVIGAVAAAVTGASGLFLGARKNRTDDMSAIVNAALAVSDRNKGDAHDCNERLVALSARVDVMAKDLAECNDRHGRAEDAMRAAGITMD